jgi:hypothetical protein
MKCRAARSALFLWRSEPRLAIDVKMLALLEF